MAVLHLVVGRAGGAKGGYTLSRPAEQIMFAEIIRAIDGPLALVPCASEKFYAKCGDCQDEATCAIRKVLAQVRTSVVAILEHTSLASACAMETAEAA